MAKLCKTCFNERDSAYGKGAKGIDNWIKKQGALVLTPPGQASGVASYSHPFSPKIIVRSTPGVKKNQRTVIKDFFAQKQQNKDDKLKGAISWDQDGKAIISLFSTGSDPMAKLCYEAKKLDGSRLVTQNVLNAGQNHQATVSIQELLRDVNDVDGIPETSTGSDPMAKLLPPLFYKHIFV